MDEVAKVAKTLLVFAFDLLALHTDGSLMNDVLKLMLVHLSEDVSVTIEVVDFLLLLLCYLVVDDSSIDLIVRIVNADVGLPLFNLLRWHNDLAVRSARLDEVHDLLEIKLVLVAETLDSGLLVNEDSVALHLCIELSELIVADVKELLLLLKLSVLFFELVTELDHVGASLLDVVQGDGKSDDLQLLLIDASIVEDALLLELVDLLFELGLDLGDLVADALEVDLPLLALLGL